MNKFKDYKDTAAQFITIFESEFYPDFLETACSIYEGIFKKFKIFIEEVDSSSDLLLKITEIPGNSERIQLLRLFRRYVSPDTSVEMLKVKKKVPSIIEHFSCNFRDIELVRKNFNSRPIPDEALCMTLYEYACRGEKGYLLTENFFAWFRKKFNDEFIIIGPERAGKDLCLSKHLDKFTLKMPTDFIIQDKYGNPIAVGFARYDSDRGGSQEDDRIKGNRNNAIELMNYCNNTKPIKVIYLNDGPGLLLGSMWDDYSSLENYDDNNILVTTLKMLDTRLTKEWLLS